MAPPMWCLSQSLVQEKGFAGGPVSGRGKRQGETTRGLFDSYDRNPNRSCHEPLNQPVSESKRFRDRRFSA